MTMLAQSSNANSMVESLQLFEWGKWARNSKDLPTLSMPSWVRQIKTLDRENNPNRYVGDIDEAYALELDSRIARLDERDRIVIVLYYVNRLTWRAMEKRTKSPLSSLREIHNLVVARLYGQMESTLR